MAFLKFFLGICLYPQLAIRIFFRTKSLKRLYLDLPIAITKPEIIHFEFGTLAVDRIYLKNVLNCKIVISFRGYDLNYVGLDQPSYYQEIWEKADVLHLLGNDLWHRAQKRGCPSDKKHALIPPAIDTEFFSQDIPHCRAEESVVIASPKGARQSDSKNQIASSSRQSGAPRNDVIRILSVGRLVWKKGYEYALQAIKILRNQGIDCEYTIIGNGPYLEAIAYARHDLGLEDSVQLLGSLSPEEVKQKMKKTDIFIHAAVSEGFCNAVIEAQAMKLPVVCTDADGLPENIVDGKIGFVVPRRDPEKMAEKIKLLAQSSELRAKMGEEGRERVERNFRIESQIEAFENLYADILSQRVD